jgi:hypothetical protein
MKAKSPNFLTDFVKTTTQALLDPKEKLKAAQK